MRKLFWGLSLFFVLFAIALAVLPLEQFAFIPAALGLIFGYLALRKSAPEQQKLPKILLGASLVILIFIIGKIALSEDEVVQDVRFEQQKTESKKEAQKELEELEELE